MQNLGEKMTDAEIEGMMKEADMNGGLGPGWGGVMMREAALHGVHGAWCVRVVEGRGWRW